jgi:hypothetical protein
MIEYITNELYDYRQCQSMIRKSAERFCEKIMLEQKARASF